jgi:hypothetical protein
MQADGNSRHAYGPVGEALGMFAGYLDRFALAAIEGAMRDAASQEWSWANEHAEGDPGKAYHAGRWYLLTLGADYAQLMAGNAASEVRS